MSIAKSLRKADNLKPVTDLIAGIMQDKRRREQKEKLFKFFDQAFGNVNQAFSPHQGVQGQSGTNMREERIDDPRQILGEQSFGHRLVPQNLRNLEPEQVPTQVPERMLQKMGGQIVGQRPLNLDTTKGDPSKDYTAYQGARQRGAENYIGLLREFLNEDYSDVPDEDKQSMAKQLEMLIGSKPVPTQPKENEILKTSPGDILFDFNPNNREVSKLLENPKQVKDADRFKIVSDKGWWDLSDPNNPKFIPNPNAPKDAGTTVNVNTGDDGYRYKSSPFVEGKEKVNALIKSNNERFTGNKSISPNELLKTLGIDRMKQMGYKFVKNNKGDEVLTPNQPSMISYVNENGKEEFLTQEQFESEKLKARREKESLKNQYKGQINERMREQGLIGGGQNKGAVEVIREIKQANPDLEWNDVLEVFFKANPDIPLQHKDALKDYFEFMSL